MEPSLITIPIREYQQLVTAVQEISKLRAELESLQEKFARDVAEDRTRITVLEHCEPEPRNRDRGEVLAALIIRNGGHIPRQEARKIMRLSESQFSQLLNASRDFIVISASRIDRRIKILSLK
jgi:DNA-binding transcriptional regulator YiaG